MEKLVKIKSKAELVKNGWQVGSHGVLYCTTELCLDINTLMLGILGQTIMLDLSFADENSFYYNGFNYPILILNDFDLAVLKIKRELNL